MKHARLVCNQREKFQCADCGRLTSNGYQLVGSGETKFVCKDCYVNSRLQYPTKGASIKHILPAEVVFSAEYDPSATLDAGTSRPEPEITGYIGELVSDGNGGWREPTAEEIRNMNAANSSSSDSTPSASNSADGLSTMTIKYRFTTDNKLQVILPKKCRIDDISYELIVTTQS